MILLDTNVLSALMKPVPDQAVAVWLDPYPRHSIWTSSITAMEIAYGIALLPTGRHRDRIQTIFTRLFDQVIADRIAVFDLPAAKEAARLTAERRRAGRPGEWRDTMIAGIAVARHATLATRNIRHFADLGAQVVNPWQPLPQG